MMTENSLRDLEIDRDILEDNAALEVVAGAVRTCLRTNDSVTLGAFFEAHEPADIATFLDRLEAGDALAALGHVDLHQQGQIVGYLKPGCRVDIANLMDRRDLARLIGVMAPDEWAGSFQGT